MPSEETNYQLNVILNLKSPIILQELKFVNSIDKKKKDI